MARKILLGLLFGLALTGFGVWSMPTVHGADNSSSGSVLTITGFEDAKENKNGLNTYNGPKSKVKFEVVSDIVHDGEKAVKISFKCADWIGVLWNLTATNGDWTGKTAVVYWIYSDGTPMSFNPVLEDANMEQFMLSYPINIDWTGWNQVTVPIADFQSRTDYQHKEAKVNGDIDYPARNFHFMANIVGEGTLYIDQLEVK